MTAVRVGDILTDDAPELPVGSMVADIDGDTWHRDSRGWFCPELGPLVRSEWDDVQEFGPLTVRVLP